MDVLTAREIVAGGGRASLREIGGVGIASPAADVRVRVDSSFRPIHVCRRIALGKNKELGTGAVVRRSQHCYADCRTEAMFWMVSRDESNRRIIDSYLRTPQTSVDQTLCYATAYTTTATT